MFTVIGIITTVEVSYSRCVEKAVATVVPSKFKGKILQGESRYRKSFNWYELNLKLALGTMESGIGTSSIDQLLSFFLSIGSTMRKLARELTDEAIKEKVRLTLNND